MRRDRERLQSKINFLLTGEDHISVEQFIEFLDSLKLEISDSKKGQLLRIFDPEDTRGNFLIRNPNQGSGTQLRSLL